MLNGDKFVEALERLKDRAYRDQTDSFSHFVRLVELLQETFCEHEFETMNVGDPPDVEVMTICKKCSAEKPSD